MDCRKASTVVALTVPSSFYPFDPSYETNNNSFFVENTGKPIGAVNEITDVTQTEVLRRINVRRCCPLMFLLRKATAANCDPIHVFSTVITKIHEHTFLTLFSFFSDDLFVYLSIAK